MNNKTVTVAVPSVQKTDQEELRKIAKKKGYLSLSSYLRVVFKVIIQENKED